MLREKVARGGKENGRRNECGRQSRDELLIGRSKFPRERDRVRRQARRDPPQRKKKLKRMLHFAYAS